MVQKILFIKVNPIGTKNLFLDVEEKELRNALKKSAKRDQFEIRSIGAVTIEELHESLEEFKPNILHISGHGADGVLYFHDNENHKKEVSILQFCNFAKNYNDHLSCVFLNACFSLAGIENLEDTFVPAVIGMQKEIPNDTAILFSRSFYTSFFGGKTIEDSFVSGLGVVGIDGFGDESIPVIKGDTKQPEVVVEQSQHARILQKVENELVSERNRRLIKEKQQKKKKSYRMIGGLIIAVSAILLVSALLIEANWFALLAILPLALIIWVKDKMHVIDHLLTLLEILEGEINRFLKSLHYPPVVGADQKVMELNGQFWMILK